VKADLLPYFEYVAADRVKCKSCSMLVTTRGGRATQHLAMHGVKPEPEPEHPSEAVAAQVVAPKPSEEPRAFARGSREWAVEKVQAIVENPSSTNEAVLKALDLLKEYQDFGTKRLDDEKEAEASRLQWERVFAKVGTLKKTEETLLKDPAVRVRLKAAIESVK
jgi:hypothetical protein